MNDLTIYNYKTLITDAQHEFVTIRGVELSDILNEYSTEEIVEALCAAEKDAEVIDELAKLNQEDD